VERILRCRSLSAPLTTAKRSVTGRIDPWSTDVTVTPAVEVGSLSDLD